MKIILTFSLSHKKRKTRKRKFQKKLTFILLFSKLQSKSKVFRLLLSSKPTFILKFWSKKSFYGHKVSFQFFCPTIIMTSFWLQWLWNCCCKVGSCFWRKKFDTIDKVVNTLTSPHNIRPRFWKKTLSVDRLKVTKKLFHMTILDILVT